MPVTEWDFVGRRHSGPVPGDVVAAITAALQGFLQAEVPAAAEPVDTWSRASRREALGEGPFSSPADLRAGRRPGA